MNFYFQFILERSQNYENVGFSISGLCFAFKTIFGLFSIYLTFRYLEHSKSIKFELFWSNFAIKTTFAENFTISVIVAIWILFATECWIKLGKCWRKNSKIQNLPPEVAFVIAQAASFRVLNSARDKMSIKTGKTLASMTAWICWRLPAVTLEIVQQASLRMLSVKIKVGLISNLVKSKRF